MFLFEYLQHGSQFLLRVSKRSGYLNQLKKYWAMLMPQFATNVKISNEISFLGLMEFDHMPTSPYLYFHEPRKLISYFLIKSCQKSILKQEIKSPCPLYFILFIRIVRMHCRYIIYHCTIKNYICGFKILTVQWHLPVLNFCRALFIAHSTCWFKYLCFIIANISCHYLFVNQIPSNDHCYPRTI